MTTLVVTNLVDVTNPTYQPTLTNHQPYFARYSRITFADRSQLHVYNEEEKFVLGQGQVGLTIFHTHFKKFL